MEPKFSSESLTAKNDRGPESQMRGDERLIGKINPLTLKLVREGEMNEI